MTAIEFTARYLCSTFIHHPVTQDEAELLVEAEIASDSWQEQCHDREYDYFIDKTVSAEQIPLLESLCLGFAPELDRRSISCTNGSSCCTGIIRYAVTQKMMFFSSKSFDEAVVLAITAATHEDVVQMQATRAMHHNVYISAPEEDVLSSINAPQICAYMEPYWAKRKGASA